LRFVVEFAKKTGVQSATIFARPTSFYDATLPAGTSAATHPALCRLRFASIAAAP
jgi:hypothetical protein